MAIREAKILLPTHGNDGEDLADVHQELRKTPVALFSGYSAYAGVGAWEGPGGKLIQEPHVAYVVSVDDALVQRLPNLARTLAQNANQDCIYLRYPSGIVELVEGE